jgi:ankyrin repeat protein
MHACANGHGDVAALLLERGAGVETVDRYGATALMGACAMGHHDVAALLLERGADVETEDR